MRKSTLVLLALLSAFAVMLSACGTTTPVPTEVEAPELPVEEKSLIVVGSKDFTEQFILGQIAVLAL